MERDSQREALSRLRTVGGHLEAVVRMIEQGAYCVDLMKQVSALQASLERVNRLILRNHLETCFSQALTEGRGSEAVAELMDAVKFNRSLTGPGAELTGIAAGEPRGGRRGDGKESRGR